MELLQLVLEGFLLELLDDVDLFEEPDLTGAQELQVSADAAVELGFRLQGGTERRRVREQRSS